jgi:acetoacetyl-CoA synthetase
VSRAAQALQALGLRAGDRVAAFIPNIPEAGMLALAALSQGIVWASCSPDFGVDGVLERFEQIEPKVLFCADGYIYNGEAHDSLERVREIAEGLKSLRKVVVVPHLNPRVEVDDVPKGRASRRVAAPLPAGGHRVRAAALQPPRLHPFTSGTTASRSAYPRRRRHAAAVAEDLQVPLRRSARATATSTTAPPTGWCGT